MNESLYECRPDYSPSPDNWVNFQKDVDNMFALRHVLNKFNRTLDDSTLPELGSGAGGGGLEEEGSGEESASAGDVWPGLAAEARITTPAPGKTPSSASPTPRPTPEMESAVNDLPEKLINRPVVPASPVTALPPGQRRDRVVFQSDMWAQQLEEIEGGMFSGNGLTELETRHNDLLRSHNSLQPGHGEATGPRGLGLGLDLVEEEDIFQAQGYLPFSPQTLRPKVQASTPGSPPTTTQTSPPQSVGVVLQALPQSALPLTLDYEGSGSLPQPSNQTL